ncbi:Cyclic nucleotide-binding domain-containing protein 2 [Holothuria leucospilota]|uniref:Cyclic nucleotide-binding domain-containing protein 2 n=1 Tax=Holothuria leucospilota TaxID=206669 RepID=A0A9Q1GZK2_HOLLE|nr:Cyclic nucleotide-binding domain-containing protein 2 [Holothuria leucospilota]
MMQQSLVKLGWYESFEAKRVIIRQGYPAERYYFIVSGTAMVSVISEDQKTKKCTIQPKALLRKGNSIGEDALMRNHLRDSTVIAETAVEVLMIEKDDFVKIYLADPNGTEPDLVHFLRSVECFSQWPVQVLRYDDPNHCLQIYFRRGSVVCKDARTSDWIYVIKTDFVKIYLADPNGTEPDLVHFLRSVECFSQWPVQVLRYDDPNHCLQIYFRRGSVVCKDARTSDWIYVIKTVSVSNLYVISYAYRPIYC